MKYRDLFRSNHPALHSKIRVENDDKIELIEQSHISYLAESGHHTLIYLIDGGHLMVQESLVCLMEKLAYKQFLQIHKSFVVRMDRITIYHKNSDEVELKNGKRLCVERSRRNYVRRIISSV